MVIGYNMADKVQCSFNESDISVVNSSNEQKKKRFKTIKSVVCNEVEDKATTTVSTTKPVSKFIEVKDKAIIKECKVSWSKQVFCRSECTLNKSLFHRHCILGHVDVAL